MTTTNQQKQTPVPPSDQPITVWVGLDWADQKHCLVVRPADGSPARTYHVEQKPPSLDDFFLDLRRQHPQGRIGVCLEQSRGPVLYALLKHPFRCLYPVNPRCLADFRGVFKVSGAKDDPADAGLLCELGHKHSDRLRPFQLNDPATRQLVLLTEHRRDTVAERTGRLNQQTATLKNYYPLALELFEEDLGNPMSRAFLQRWPNLAAVQKAKPGVLRAFFSAHHSRSEEKILARLAAIAAARPLTEDAVIVSVMQLRMESLLEQLAAAQKSVARYDQEIAAVFATHAKQTVFASFPGAGPALAPRLAAAFGTVAENFLRPLDMLCWSAMAPVKQQSGQMKRMHFRYARPKFLHQTFVEYARISVQFSPWAKRLYEKLREKNWRPFRAYRYIAFKWIRILWRCWKDGLKYDEIKYLQSLQKRGAPLYQSLYPAPAPAPAKTGE